MNNKNILRPIKTLHRDYLLADNVKSRNRARLKTLVSITYKSRLDFSCQKLSQKDVRPLVRSADADSVLGNGGGSFWGGGEAINRDGLEQFPKADLDRDPLCESRDLEGGLSGEEGGVEGEEQYDSNVARLLVLFFYVFMESS